MFLNHLCRTAQKAGDAIMVHYRQVIEIERKADASPVTVADRDAHAVIARDLAALDATIHLISEEQEDAHVLPEGVTRYWLVDPLDGTKSFVRGTGEFTVNIALIEEGVPVLGVIYLPVQRVLYAGVVGQGAWRQADGEARAPIMTRKPNAAALDAVVSHSHLDAHTQTFVDGLPIASRVSAASSLKFCRVAEGVADVYPRFGPTMEWDTAAGHAIVLAAGGRMEQPDGTPFTYGKPAFRNGAFVVWGR